MSSHARPGGTQWAGGKDFNSPHGFGSGARQGVRREGRENPDAPRGAGIIGQGPQPVPKGLVAAMRGKVAGKAAPIISLTKADSWELVAEIDEGLTRLKARSEEAVKAKNPDSEEELAYEDALGWCQQMMRGLGRVQYLYVVNEGCARGDKMVELGSRLNEVIKDNVWGCVNQAKKKFLDE